VKTEDAIKYFRTRARLAGALGIKPPSISEWKDEPPPLRQLQLERITNGELKAEQHCDTYRVGEAV
jgi:DNA-binding transcriptional regulator YdaS (Cro superfamily)